MVPSVRTKTRFAPAGNGIRFSIIAFVLSYDSKVGVCFKVVVIDLSPKPNISTGNKW